MTTGIYYRVERDGKCQSLDITELTESELEKLIWGLSWQELKNHVKWFINYVKEIKEQDSELDFNVTIQRTPEEERQFKKDIAYAASLYMAGLGVDEKEIKRSIDNYLKE